jgi:hypothetical protein
MKIKKERWMVALALCLLWIIAAILSNNLIPDTYGQIDFIIIALFSLILFIVGMVAFFGRIRVFFLLSYPAILFYSEIDTSKYNIEKASFVLGILTAVFSYVLLFILLGNLMMAIMIIVTVAFVIGLIYVFVAKRFKAEARPKY